MGQFGPSMERFSQSNPMMGQSQNWMQDLMGRIPQLGQLEAPATEQSLADMVSSIGTYGGDLSKYFQGQMQGTDPGAQQVKTALGGLGELGDINRQKAWREATSRGYGAGSTAGIRSGIGAMREGDLMNMLTQAQIQLDQINKQRGFQQQGAQGLMNMPSYFAQPSSVEMGLLGLQSPRDIAGMQSQMQGLGMEGNMLNTMLAGSWDEQVMMPGWGQTILSPMLNALMGGLGKAIPGMDLFSKKT